MRGLIRSIAFYLVVLAALFTQGARAQSVIDPADPVVNYNSANPPMSGWHEMKKWVRTPNTNVQNRNGGWTANNYKCYNWDGLAFRVRFPKNYSTSNDGKKYPLIVFLHGKGEIAILKNGQNYDNEFQLLQGPYEFEQAILNDTWNGYVVAAQVTDLYYDSDFERIMQIVDYMIANNKVDPFGIIADGLSSGGLGTYQIFNKYPLYFSTVAPISPPVALDLSYWAYDQNYLSNKRYTPIWMTQGGTDTNPNPATTQQLQDSMFKYGANFKRTVYAGVGHGTWYNFWAEPGFWPFINRTYQSNPWALFGKNQFWPGEPVKATIGVMPGLEAYEWRKNGASIAAAGNEIQVNSIGVYDARVKKNGIWSEWSRYPVTVKNNDYRVEAEDWVKMSGVTLQRTTDGDSYLGLNVTSISNGDYMDYTVQPYLSGTYTLKFRLAAASTGAQFKVIDTLTNAVLATVNVPRTFGSQTWTTYSISFPMTAGKQTFMLKSTSSTTFNINWMEFSMAVQSPLPVKFVYFNAQCESTSVNLKWKTAAEQNSLRFSVQKSVDGANWSEIGSVAASGQTTEEKSYSFTDRTTATGYYRIVEYDQNRQTTITSIVKSNCSVKTELSLYPNPTSGNSALNITVPQRTSLSIEVLDGKGMLLQQKVLQLPAGSTTVPLNMSNYADGIYTIIARYDGEMKALKMIKR
jgi:predicted esterase